MAVACKAQLAWLEAELEKAQSEIRDLHTALSEAKNLNQELSRWACHQLTTWSLRVRALGCVYRMADVSMPSAGGEVVCLEAESSRHSCCGMAFCQCVALWEAVDCG